MLGRAQRVRHELRRPAIGREQLRRVRHGLRHRTGLFARKVFGDVRSDAHPMWRELRRRDEQCAQLRDLRERMPHGSIVHVERVLLPGRANQVRQCLFEHPNGRRQLRRLRTRL